MSIYENTPKVDAASAITGQILEHPNPEISVDSWVFRHFLSQTRICGMWHDGKIVPVPEQIIVLPDERLLGSGKTIQKLCLLEVLGVKRG